MTGGTSYQQVFGGTAIQPSNPSYAALTIAANTALAWPTETSSAPPVVAAQMDVTASTTGLSLAMPPGNTGSTGVAATITNVGSNSFTLTDQAGNSLGVIASTQAWIVVLTDNTTTNGSWRLLQLASTTSSATAASLAGAGLQVNGSLLQMNWTVEVLSANTSIGSTYRAQIIEWTGAVGTLQYAAITTLGQGFVSGIVNNGTGALTLSSSASDPFNGAPSLVLQPGNSGLLVAGPGGFVSVGAIIEPLGIANGGTGAANAPAALSNLGGTAIGQAIFTAPNAGSVVSLLGLNNFTFNEATISTSQTLTSGSANQAYVATAAITLTLPLTTTSVTTFVFSVYAEGGAVTLTPQATDSIDGGAAGASFIIPKGHSVLLTTDANGNYWPFFTPKYPFTEATVSSSFALTAGSANHAYVASAAITITLPLSSTLTSEFTFSVLAQGGNVTLTPQAGDSINGGSTGASVVVLMGNSAQLITDAAGHFYLLFDAGAIATNSLNGGALAGFRNTIINGNFQVNQRAYVSGTALSSGVYGHDRWKAGSGGCTYSFTEGVVDTAITITAGTLQQVVESVNVAGGTYTLSWTGTALGSINGGTPAISPITASGLTAATNITISFAIGTVALAQLEPGPVATPFERRMLQMEQMLCQRYYQTFAGDYEFYSGAAAENVSFAVAFQPPMRAAPTITTVTTGTASNISSTAFNALSVGGLRLTYLSAGVAGYTGAVGYRYAASVEL